MAKENVPEFAVSLTFLAIATALAFVFLNLTFLFLRRMSDGARYSLGWIKTSFVLVNAFCFCWAITLILGFSEEDFSIDNALVSQLNAVTAFLEPLALSTILVTQLEMALGLRYASGLSSLDARLGDTRIPRLVARISYVVAIILTLTRFAAIEYYIVAYANGTMDSPETALKGLQIGLWLVLLAQAIACSVYASYWCRPTTRTTVYNMLIAMCSISLARHSYEFVASIIAAVQGEIRALHSGIGVSMILSTLFRPCTAVASMIIAYYIARKNENGLWGDRDGLHGRPNKPVDPENLRPRRI